MKLHIPAKNNQLPKHLQTQLRNQLRNRLRNQLRFWPHSAALFAADFAADFPIILFFQYIARILNKLFYDIIVISTTPIYIIPFQNAMSYNAI